MAKKKTNKTYNTRDMRPEKDGGEKTRSIPYHFSGSGEYKPMTVYASDHKEAYREWLKKRVKK